jgi:AcrR family transcriptional regulator
VPRAIPSDRLTQLIEVATEVFIAQGYRGTQIEDVAHRLGVAKGTIYGSVQSKDALFDLALRHADGHESLPEVAALPLPTPGPDATVTWLRQRLENEARDLELLSALSRERILNVRAELTAILRDLYARMERNRRGIKLVDRCALDRPELATVWFGDGRWAQHTLIVQYLDRCIARGRLRRVPSTAIAARMILETLAFWAVHRHWDPAPQQVAEEAVQTTVIDMLVCSLAKEET